MSTGQIRIDFSLRDESLEPEQWDDATESLRQGLQDVGARLVRPGAAGATRPGTKGDPLTLSLIAALVASPVLSEVVRMAASWVGRTQHRSVELTGPSGSLTVTGHPKAEEEALIEAWLRNNASAGNGTTPDRNDSTSTDGGTAS